MEQALTLSKFTKQSHLGGLLLSCRIREQFFVDKIIVDMWTIDRQTPPEAFRI